MKRIYAALLALLFATAAYGQSTSLKNHAVAVGKGTNVQGFTSVGPGTAGLPFVGAGASADPLFALLGYAGGGTNANTQVGARNNMLPTPTRAGDVVYWSGTVWVTLAGNNSGSNCFGENASGVPSWVTCSGGGGTPGGSSGQVQFNNAGSFGGLTNTQLTALINVATTSLPGAVPAWPNNTTTFFRGDGTYSAVSLSSLTGAGTGFLAAGAINVGTAGSVVVNGGALGSPSSVGTLPALTLGGTVSGGGQAINNILTLAATTSITSPVHIGDTTAAGVAEIRATSGVGVGLEKIRLTIGNNGATEAGLIQAPAAFTGLTATQATMKMGNLAYGSWPNNPSFGQFFGLASLDQTAGGNYNVLIGTSGDLYFNTPTGQIQTYRIGNGNVFGVGVNGVGYLVGIGGSVTQLTSRTTGVTLNKPSGAITLFSQINSAVSAATAQTFTVTNSTVAVTDTIIVNQKSGTDTYLIFVRNVSAGSFQITMFTTGGTTNEAPVFTFNIIKGVIT